MRKINEIIIHCSGTKSLNGYGVKQIKEYHILHNHWSDCGYHFIIKTDGTIEVGRPIHRAGAHCKGHNRHSIGICYVGGLNDFGQYADTRTLKQRLSMISLVYRLCKNYPIISISGHCDYCSRKACPCFDAKNEFKEYVKTKNLSNNPNNEIIDEKGN